MDDKDLLILLKAGNRNAFDAIFKKYASKLYFFSLQFFDHAEEAEEIVQETFLKIWESRTKIDENQNFGTYLITIAKHLIYNLLKHKLVVRKYQEYTQVLPENQSYIIEDGLVLEDLKNRLSSGISLLPPQQKEILRLKNQGYPNEEIALRLNLSKRTVEAHINKAFKTIRNYLAEKR